ncbi:MAG: GNAT family N-acetyltransferase [Phycisphaerae bacterium]|nr:GNAT family N-acetyltransferase [Phycisphaerae bacterium]
MFTKPFTAGIRQARPEDRASVLGLLKRTDFFRPGELTIAAEVYDEAIAAGAGGDYQSFVAREVHETIGWVCWGPTPCTVGTFDIYWLAVDPDSQRGGVGRSLVHFAENAIKNRGGRLIVVDTSGSARYEPSRRFYEKMEFVKEGQIADFYAVGDDKVIYVKRL